MNADGTQPPEPPHTFSDPLAGPRPPERHGMSGSDDHTEDMEIAAPVEPDPEMVRGMVDAAIREEEAGWRRTEARGMSPDGDGGDGVVTGSHHGVLNISSRVTDRPWTDDTPTDPFPRLPRSFGARPSMLPLILGLRQRGAHAAEGDHAPPRPQPKRKPSSGTAGIALALVLLVLFIVLAIQFVTSLFTSIAELFS